jgi:hypothetical protein
VDVGQLVSRHLEGEQHRGEASGRRASAQLNYGVNRYILRYNIQGVSLCTFTAFIKIAKMLYPNVMQSIKTYMIEIFIFSNFNLYDVTFFQATSKCVLRLYNRVLFAK